MQNTCQEPHCSKNIKGTCGSCMCEYCDQHIFRCRVCNDFRCRSCGRVCEMCETYGCAQCVYNDGCQGCKTDAVLFAKSDDDF